MIAARWSDTLVRPHPPREWLWPGWLAPGHSTLLRGPWRSGKTALLRLLLARRVAAGTLLGQPVRQGVTAIVTSRTLLFWRERLRVLPLGRSMCFFNPRSGPAALADITAVFARLLELRREHGVDLVVFDPLELILSLPADARAHAVRAVHPVTPAPRGRSGNPAIAHAI